MAGGVVLNLPDMSALGPGRPWGILCRLRSRGLRKHRQCLTEVFIETILGSHVVVRNYSKRSQLSFARLSLKSHFVTGQCHSRVLTLTQLPHHPLPWRGPRAALGLGPPCHARSYVDLNLASWSVLRPAVLMPCDISLLRKFCFSGNL